VGLGIMGLPMARNLVVKMSSDTQFYIYDVVRDSIDKLVNDGQGRVHACGSSKEVADKSVRFIPTKIFHTALTHHSGRTSFSPWCPKAATCDLYT